MGMFNKDLKIGSGEKYDMSKVSQDGVNLEEIAKNNKKLIDIFNKFDLDGDKKLNDIELAKAMDAFAKMDDGDCKLSKKELDAGAATIGENISGGDLKSFIKKVTKATKNDATVSTQARIQQEQSLQSLKDVAPDLEEVTPPEIIKLEVKAEEKKPVLGDYTVQEGESYTDLIIRSLKAQGIENPTKEQIKEAKEKFQENNPGMVKSAKNGVEFLPVGAKVKIEGGLEDKNNAKEQQEQWAGKYAKPADPVDPIDTVTTDPNATKAAKEKGLRATHSPIYFYDEKTGIHYIWDAEKGEFRESKNTVYVGKDGSFRKEFKNNDGSTKSILYGKDGYPTTMDARTEDGKLYINEGSTVERLGLKETFRKGVYYDPETKMHYKWNNDTHQLDALGKDVRIVGKDGTEFDKDGKLGSYQLKKDGTEVVTWNDGSTETRTYNAAGKTTKCVYKDKDGNEKGSIENT